VKSLSPRPLVPKRVTTDEGGKESGEGGREADTQGTDAEV